jgi:hypothetical protein
MAATLAAGLNFVAVAASDVYAENTLPQMMVQRIDMLHHESCLKLIVLQDDFSKGNSTEFEKVMLLHSFVDGVGSTLFPNDNDRFALAMGVLFRECLAVPDKPMSEIAISLASK